MLILVTVISLTSHMVIFTHIQMSNKTFLGNSLL